MRLERVFVPVLVLLLCGLLAFLTFWRVDNFGAKGRWSEFVESSPAVIKDASARAETASSFIEDAIASTPTGPHIDELRLMGGLVEQDFFYAYDMAAFGSELRNYMSGRLSRVEAE